MNTEKTITIAEYARARGVSTASVYKRLDKSLKPWAVVEGGKKCLLARVIVEEQPRKNVNHSTTNSGKKVDNQRAKLQTAAAPDDSILVQDLREQVTFLRAEIEARRKEAEAQRDIIREKDRVIQEKDQQLIDFGAKFAELAAKNAELVDQAHRLNAADKPRMIQGSDADQEAMQPVYSQTDEIVPPEAPAPTEESKPARGWLARLFGFD